jgi:hypothetical protein
MILRAVILFIDGAKDPRLGYKAGFKVSDLE